MENIEEADDFGKNKSSTVELKPDYKINVSSSSYENWLKKHNLVAVSSEKEDNLEPVRSESEEQKSTEDICKIDTSVASEVTVEETVIESSVINVDLTIDSNTDTIKDTSQQSTLINFSEDEICEHYANLATSVIACFSLEFKLEERVNHLQKILNILEQDKDDVIAENRKQKNIV